MPLPQGIQTFRSLTLNTALIASLALGIALATGANSAWAQGASYADQNPSVYNGPPDQIGPPMDNETQEETDARMDALNEQLDPSDPEPEPEAQNDDGDWDWDEADAADAAAETAAAEAAAYAERWGPDGEPSDPEEAFDAFMDRVDDWDELNEIEQAELDRLLDALDALDGDPDAEPGLPGSAPARGGFCFGDDGSLIPILPAEQALELANGRSIESAESGGYGGEAPPPEVY